MRLDELRWQEVEEYLKRDDRVVLPIGSTEQHGTRGLIGTDTICPDAIATEAAHRAGVLCAPVAAYGMAEHHMAFPGTVSLRPSTYHAMMKDVLRSLHHHGLKKIFVLNGHGGNTAPMQCSLSEICNEISDLRVQLYCWWQLSEVAELIQELFGEKEGTHGTPSEVSVTMFVKSGVKFAENVPVGGLGEEGVFVNREMARKLSPTGLYGEADPNLASAEHGERLFECAVQAAVSRLGTWK
jgi:creatinine amidohydrolase